MFHPNEVILVQRGESGAIIPTRDGNHILAVVALETNPAYRRALAEQINRQTDVLRGQPTIIG